MQCAVWLAILSEVEGWLQVLPEHVQTPAPGGVQHPRPRALAPHPAALVPAAVVSSSGQPRDQH